MFTQHPVEVENGYPVSMGGRWVSAGLLALGLLFAVLSPSSGYAAKTAQLVMFESEGCYWCETWHAEVGVIYSKTGEGEMLPLRRIDLDEDLPTDLAHVPRLFYTPTFVIMEDGKELARITGYPGEDFFWQMLDEIIEGMDSKRAAAP